MPKENLRALFLREFVKNLIENVKLEPLPELPETKEKLETRIPSSLVTAPEKRFVPIVDSLKIKPRFPKPFLSKKRMIPVRNEISSKIMKAPINQIQQPNEYGDLGKIASLISDPGIENIECPGPNKHLLVKKGGRVQKTGILLTSNEIKKIIKDFSEKTKIPLIKGTFKAVFGNLILTAIISEFAETNFILQKKTPLSFQNPS